MWMVVVKANDQTQREYLLQDDEVRLGRSPKCQILLDDPTVSGFHARFIKRDGTYIFQDLNSTNGTYVDKRKVQHLAVKDGLQAKIANFHISVIAVTDKLASTHQASVSSLADAARFRVGNQDNLRQGEAGSVPFRTGRHYSVNGEWFFSTRESGEQGPFLTLEGAKTALLNYGRRLGFIDQLKVPADKQSKTAVNSPS